MSGAEEDKSLLPLMRGAWLGKPSAKKPNKRRFFQLSADGASLRWSWRKYVRLFYLEAMDVDRKTLTLTLKFTTDPDLTLKFPNKTKCASASPLPPKGSIVQRSTGSAGETHWIRGTESALGTESGSGGAFFDIFALPPCSPAHRSACPAQRLLRTCAACSVPGNLWPLSTATGACRFRAWTRALESLVGNLMSPGVARGGMPGHPATAPGAGDASLIRPSLLGRASMAPGEGGPLPAPKAAAGTDRRANRNFLSHMVGIVIRDKHPGGLSSRQSACSAAVPPSSSACIHRHIQGSMDSSMTCGINSALDF